MSADANIFIETPLIYSDRLSDIAGCEIWLKLENLQPSGSFKLRGISHLIKNAVRSGHNCFVTSSGGNAGLAAAYATRKLSKPITVYLPSTTPEKVRQTLRSQGTEVIVHGNVWNEADVEARCYSERTGAFYVPPFDHPDIWEGNSTIVRELATNPNPGVGRPGLIVCSVGGGGLLCGLCEGLLSVGWADVPVLAMETFGADCLNKSITNGRLTTLDSITSIATSLGSLVPAKKAFEFSKELNVISKVITDKSALNSCYRILDDHRFLVEPACGASFSAVYDGIISNLIKSGEYGAIKRVCLVVCGGAAVSTDLLQQWRARVNRENLTLT